MQKNALTIRHVGGDSSPQFIVIRGSDSRSTAPVKITPPDLWPIKKDGKSRLASELRWYLEDFLSYPFSPATERAERALQALNAWSTHAYDSLFATRQGASFISEAASDGYGQMQIRVCSESPQILSWPWESIHDNLNGHIALQAAIERRVEATPEPLSTIAEAGADCAHILLVISRPFEDDARYRSIATTITDLLHDDRVPIKVTLLRPPTFDQLRQHLQAEHGKYLIIHFDGHGLNAKMPGSYQHQGHLVFETEQGRPDHISASTIADLIRTHNIPCVILNACQSAKPPAESTDMFSSTACSLVKAGVSNVLAMSYAVHVDAAKAFFKSFYSRLFQTGDLSEATRAGRQQMLSSPERICPRGNYPLQDWFVPVFYRQSDVFIKFRSESSTSLICEPPTSSDSTEPAPESIQFSDEALPEVDPYGFIGRDEEILLLERAMQRSPSAIVLHGLGGIGKTALARRFLRWQRETSDITAANMFWLRFGSAIRGIEDAINKLTVAIIGPKNLSHELSQRATELAEFIRSHRIIIVWDNFESFSGSESGLEGAIYERERQVLTKFLSKLRGGQGKIIVTSRHDEAWLGSQNRFSLRVSGLHPEDQWKYCETILKDLGIVTDRGDPDLYRLVSSLEGHPLAIKTLVPLLEHHSPSDLSRLLNFSKHGDKTAKELQSRVGRVIKTALEKVPEAFSPLMNLLSLHEAYVEESSFLSMANGLPQAFSSEDVNSFFTTLTRAGLLKTTKANNQRYEIHPLLGKCYATAYQSHRQDPGVTATAFLNGITADVCQRLSEDSIPWANFEQKRANIARALVLAQGLQSRRPAIPLLWALAIHTQEDNDLNIAETMFKDLLVICRAEADRRVEIDSYHHLGLVYQAKENFEKARECFQAELDAGKETGRVGSEADAHHHLGIVAQLQRQFSSARDHFLAAVNINTEFTRRQALSRNYQQLGMLAHQEGNSAEAEARYKEAIEINEQIGDSAGTAIAYHQLGMLAHEAGEFDLARDFYTRSLTIKKKVSNSLDAAITLHQLAELAFSTGDHEEAERLHAENLIKREFIGDRIGAASSSHQLGMLAQRRRNISDAKQWYTKAASLLEGSENVDVAINTYGHLTNIAIEERELDAAAYWREKSRAIMRLYANDHELALSFHQSGVIAHMKYDFENAKQHYMTALNFFGASPMDAAKTYHQLGMVSHALGEFEESERWYNKSIDGKKLAEDLRGLARTYFQLGLLCMSKGDLERGVAWTCESMAINVKSGTDLYVAHCHHQLGMFAQRQDELDSAEEHYSRATDIYERLESEHELGITFFARAGLAIAKFDLEEARKLFSAAESIFIKKKDDLRRNEASKFLSFIDAMGPMSKAEFKEQFTSALDKIKNDPHQPAPLDEAFQEKDLLS